MKGKFLKTGISLLLTSAMVITAIPASPASAANDAAKATPILDTAIASYDFNDWAIKEGDEAKLVNGDKEIVLESVGNGAKPALADDERRGKVLSLTQQDYANRGDALLPENPFAGKSVDNGFTLNFWTKTTGEAAGNRCLVDFEVAPAKDPAATGDPNRAGTLAFNQQMVYWNTTSQNGKFTDFGIGDLGLNSAGWKMVTMAVTKKGIAFYADGVKIEHKITAGTEDYEQMIKDMAGTGGLCDNASQTNVRLGASLAVYWHCAGALMDDVSFYEKALSDDEVKALYQETLVEIPLEKVTVSGKNEVDQEKSVQLSVSLEPSDTTVDKKVTWTPADPAIISVDENGKATGLKAGKTTVTAKVGDKTSEPFEITVNPVTDALENGYYLTVYSTQKDFYASTGNIEDETRSVYMAVSKDGKTFDVLNNGGGVIFAKKGTQEITDPRIFKEDGKFVVRAQDMDATKGFHKFTSDDGVHYYEEAEESTKTPQPTPSLKGSSFPLMLKGKNILTEDDTITLGNAVSLTEQEYKYIVDKLGTVVNTGLQEKLTDISVAKGTNISEVSKQLEKYSSVNATYSDGSAQKFNVEWSGLDKVDTSKPGTYTLTGKVKQTKYLNNLKAINGSTLPEDDPNNVNSAEPDNYNEANGEVYYDKTKFVEGMADPMIYWDEQTGYYYMTGSYFPEESDAAKLPGDKTEQYDRVVLRRGKTLEELQDRSKQVTIWKVGNQEFEDAAGNNVAKGERYIWAPEIHRVGNNWVVYFTESHGGLFNIFCHALVLSGDKDPYETALKTADGQSEWKDYQMRGGTGLTDAITKSFCLDMTYFKDAVNGQSYVIWASKGYNDLSKLYMAKVDETEPWKLTSDIVLLTTPEYGWERVRFIVNEGATVLQKDGNIFMCFSASGTGSEYAIGMMSAKAGTDLLDLKNWKKNPYPLLTSRDVDGEEGPGHNSFTVDKDGNAIFVYHARPTSHNYEHCGWDGNKSLHFNSEPLNDPCRHARLKRVHWAADGTPILKMTYEDELKEQYQTLSLKVNVTGSANTSTVKSVKITNANKNKLTLGVKEPYTLKASVTASSAKDKKVTWSSDKSSIVSVGKNNGKLTAKKAGKAKITATSTVDKSKKVTVTVTVKKAPDKKAKVTLNKKSVNLKTKGKNKTFTIKPKVASKYGCITFKYSVDKKGKKIVSVDKNGKVTAKKKGKATVTVKTYNGKGKAATLKVTVK